MQNFEEKRLNNGAGDVLTIDEEQLRDSSVSAETRESAAGSADTECSGFTLYVCVFSLVLSLFLAALDIMIVTTLIEDVAKQFGDYSKTGWIFAGYSLPNAVLSLLWGRVAAVAGFKSSMLAAIVIFEIGSLISGVSNSMDMLIGGRVLAGVGGSGIQGLCFVIGSSMVHESKRGIIIAFMSSAFGIASVAGPFMGGAFTTHVTWRWCFFINLPVGGLAFAFFVIFYNPKGTNQSVRTILSSSLKKSLATMKRSRRLLKISTWRWILHELFYAFDIIEFVICTAGIVLILLAFSLGGSKFSWNSGSIIAMFVVGIILTVLALVYDFVIFPRFETAKGNIKYQPLIPWRVFSDAAIFKYNVAQFFVCMAFMCQVIYVVQFFQLVYNDSAWKASVHMLASVVPTVITVIFSGIINNKFRMVKPIMLLGVLSGIVGAGLITLLDNTSSNSQHIGLLILPGVAFGATLQSSMIGSQIQLDKKSPTYRSDFIAVITLNSFLKNLGQAIGGIVCNTVFSTSILNKLKDHDIHLGERNTADGLVIYRSHHFDGARSLLGNLISDSIKNVFYMALGFCAIAFVFGIFTSNKKIERKPKPESIASADTSGLSEQSD